MDAHSITAHTHTHTHIVASKKRGDPHIDRKVLQSIVPGAQNGTPKCWETPVNTKSDNKDSRLWLICL